jgi:hypothetical protein
MEGQVEQQGFLVATELHQEEVVEQQEQMQAPH